MASSTSYQQICATTLFTLVLFVCIHSGNSLQCFQCNSATDENCAGGEGAHISESFLRTCPDATPNGEKYILCRKIKQIIDFEVNGLLPNTRIIRACGWDNTQYKNKCYNRSGFGGRQEVCACETEKCNGSSTIYGSIALLLGLLVLKMSL